MFTSARKGCLVWRCVQRTMSDERRGRRVLFNIPGSDERKLNKVKSLDLDVAVFDLEDGVAPNRKEEARKMVREHLQKEKYPPHMEKSIRMNHVGSDLERDDLYDCIIPSLPHLDSVLIPKVESQDQLAFVAWHITQAIQKTNRETPVELLAAIESAKGILNLSQICETKLPRQVALTGLIYASEDLCADMGMTRTPSRKEMMYTRQKLLCTAKAFRLDAIDLVCIDFKNDEVLFEEAVEGSQMGFTGKQAIHPKQIETIYKAFSPPKEKVEFAHKIVSGFEEQCKQGKGAFEVDGKMIDMPMVKWAQGILRLSNNQR